MTRNPLPTLDFGAIGPVPEAHTGKVAKRAAKTYSAAILLEYIVTISAGTAMARAGHRLYARGESGLDGRQADAP
jgi:hypothetical protein